MLASDAFGALTAELRRAEANHHNPETLLPRLVAARPLDDADDIAAVLHHRLASTTTRRTGTSRRRATPRLIVGLIPQATGPMSDDMRRALDERHHLIEQRARALAETTLADNEPWTRHLGEPPRDPRRHSAWIRHVQTITAYRDRYHITTDTPLGPPPEHTAQRVDAARARAALTDAQHFGEADRPDRTARASTAGRDGPSI